MGNNRLSYSAITTYTTCGYKYYLRHHEKLKGKFIHAALAFGSAIDAAINVLLATKDIKEAEKKFDGAWKFARLRGKDAPLESLRENETILYSDYDFDPDFLLPEDYEQLNAICNLSSNYDGMKLSEIYGSLQAKKKEIGFNGMTLEDKKLYNHYNWLCLYRKGFIILQSYEKKVVPKIKEVLAIQKESFLENEEGDKLIQILDIIVRWEDGRVVLFDNKTSSRDYDVEEASTSPQLLSYYHGNKEAYKIEAIGFIVMKKGILKNKVKICSLCKKDGTGGRHRTCDASTGIGQRCNGEWDVTIDPQCHIQIIISDVNSIAENFVLESFNLANEGIKNQNWYRNLSACGNCEYQKFCWNNDDSDLIQ